MPTALCPLCFNASILAFHRDKKRDYLRCSNCRLVFVPSNQHLNQTEEKAIYDLHQNQLDDPGYQQFLSRLTTPLQSKLSPHSTGLDFGCGPGPLLARILEEQGHNVKVYDPFYANHPHLLQRHYDFITCTEVVEHFREPHQNFRLLFGMLKPNGLLGLMTKLVIDADAFSRWHYKNDLTHVGFYSEETLHWLADQYHCQIEILGKDVIIFSNRA